MGRQKPVDEGAWEPLRGAPSRHTTHYEDTRSTRAAGSPATHPRLTETGTWSMAPDYLQTSSPPSPRRSTWAPPFSVPNSRLGPTARLKSAAGASDNGIGRPEGIRCGHEERSADHRRDRRHHRFHAGRRRRHAYRRAPGGEAFDVYSCDVHSYDPESDLLTYLAFWDMDEQPGDSPMVCDSHHKVSEQVTGLPFHPDLRPSFLPIVREGQMIEVHRDDPDLLPAEAREMDRWSEKSTLDAPLSSMVASSASSAWLRRGRAADSPRRSGSSSDSWPSLLPSPFRTPPCSAASSSGTARWTRSSGRAAH